MPDAACDAVGVSHLRATSELNWDRDEFASQPFGQLVRVAVRTLRVSEAAIVLDEPHRRAIAGGQRLLQAGSSSIAGTLGGEVLASGLPVFVSNLHTSRADIAWLPSGGVAPAVAIAAYPIRSADDSLAALCVLDSQERTWTAADRESLRDLASAAATELDLRKAIAAGVQAGEALLHAQKMESLGVLAGGVSHDFNNLLTAILGFAGMLKRSPGIDSEDRNLVEMIEQAARRGADITGRLLAFARGGLARFAPVNMTEVVTETIELVRPAIPRALALSVDLPQDAMTVEGDKGQLVQALLNVVLNARDALAGTGRIDVRLRATGADAVLTVADDGPGMDDQTRVRIFEPFFTTKGAGSGTGLGMAITYGIVQGHHGTIAVDSVPGAGATFTITLPLAAGAESQDAYSAGDGNLVLVVDDDAMVRRATSAVLAELGYNVVEAGGGSQAVQILKARPGRFAAVLLDLVMPGMTGMEAFREMTAVRPDLPVVVVTGYAAEAHIDDDMKRQVAALLQKPFATRQLAEALMGVGAEPSRPRAIPAA